MAIIDCWECGNQVSDQAPTCPHCGAPRTENARDAEPDTPAASGAVSPEVRARLQEAKKLSGDVTCLECGYNGPMGIEGVHFPLLLRPFTTWWFIGPIFVGVGMLFGVWAAASVVGPFWIFAYLLRKIHVQCPSCERVLALK